MSMFDTAAEMYDRARPAYPEFLIDYVIAGTGLRPGDRVLEVGCGTGQATVALAQRGLGITCIEAGPSLAAIARRNLAEYADSDVINSRFEDWPARPDFDAVMAATSWHWLDPATSYAKAAAALRPGGMLAIWMVTHVFPEGGDPIFYEIQDVYDEIGEGLPPDREYTKPGELWSRRKEIEGSGLFELVAEREFDWETSYDADGYIDLLNTYSGHITMQDWQKDRLFGEFRRRLSLRPDGRLRRHFGSMVSVARKSA